MLSEERWTFVLSNLDHEMSRRIAQIEAEKAKTLANDYLTDEEKEIIVKEKTRILYAMVSTRGLILSSFLSPPSSSSPRLFT